MLDNLWHKKERPLLGLTGMGGGVGSNLVAAEGTAPYYDSLDPLGDGSQVGYWKLVSATTPNENSTGNTCSALHGTPTFTDLEYSKYWNNPHSSSIDTNHNPRSAYPLSFSIWCYKPTGDWTTGDQNQQLVNWSIGGQRLSITCVDWTDNGTWDWSIMYGGSGHWLFVPTSRPENQWMHLVYSVAASNSSSSKIYQDGGSAINGTDKAGGHGGSAGTTLGGNSTGVEDFNGWMYNVRLFNRQLSQSEAADLYDNDKPPGA